MAFPFFTIFIIIVLFLAFRYRSLNRKQDDQIAEFWAAEAAANSAPTADLSTLSYITLPLSRFPIGRCNDEAVRSIEEQLLALADAKSLNLASVTNTELKATYGVANFEKVSQLGDTFDTLMLLLKDYAEALVERELYAEVIPVLEFAVGVKSDISAHYILLGTCYQKLGKDAALARLIEQVESCDLRLKASILRQLKELG